MEKFTMPTRTPPPNSIAPSESSKSNDYICFICQAVISHDSQECYIICTCKHVFHRTCIEQTLSSSSECPECKKSCELSDLRKYTAIPTTVTEISTQTDSNKKSRPVVRGKPRGAMAYRPHTRSVSRDLFMGNVNSSLEFSPRNNSANLVEIDNRTSPPNNHNNPQRFSNFPVADDHHVSPRPTIPVNTEIDYERVHQMVESSLTRILQSMNFRPTTDNIQGPNFSAQQMPPTCGSLPSAQPRTVSASRHSSGCNLPVNSSENNGHIRPEKATSIIQNWNVKFSGSSADLTVEEFLYRIKSLTAEHFNDNFEIICKNLPVLLTGKADKWYWRYHRQVESIQWNEFCAALRYQFKDMRSSFDLKEEVRNRKMKAGESFDSFYDAVCLMVDKLDHPLPEEELVGILVRNLRLDIRHELLYVPIYSISHLRKLVQMRENLLKDETYRKALPLKLNPSAHTNVRRNIAEIQDEEEEMEKSPQPDSEVATVTGVTCWNCDEKGHFWDDCLRERRVFCYGCGTPNVYKPQCTRCANKRTALASKNLSRQDQPPNRQ